MPDEYTTDGARVIADVDGAGNLVDWIELTGRTNPHGIPFTVRVRDEGDAPEAELVAKAKAKAKSLETLYD